MGLRRLSPVARGIRSSFAPHPSNLIIPTKKTLPSPLHSPRAYLPLGELEANLRRTLSDRGKKMTPPPPLSRCARHAPSVLHRSPTRSPTSQPSTAQRSYTAPPRVRTSQSSTAQRSYTAPPAPQSQSRSRPLRSGPIPLPPPRPPTSQSSTAQRSYTAPPRVRALRSGPIPLPPAFPPSTHIAKMCLLRPPHVRSHFQVPCRAVSFRACGPRHNPPQHHGR